MFIPPTIAKLSLGLGLTIAFAYPVFSQITPNGAGTLVNAQGNQINITGGTQAGGNLFHSFQDFNVNSNQVANFLSNSQTQNILGRINGGNPSFINGLLQVTRGNSNLFLMNPAGIVFGANASLNVPASFTATTANQIGFGNNVFNAFGNNNFSALTGNPDSFLFTTNQAGSIVNAGNLAVGNGENLSLIAGNTINTGRLTAPGGEVQVLAVPGTNRVRLSQPGQVLSLEIVPPDNNQLRGVDLPALLTGQNLPGIVTNGETVQVAGISLPSSQGLAVASGRIDVSNPTGNGGVVQVMGDRVAAIDSRINANGATGGGTVRLGGEYLGGINTGIAPALRFNSQRTLVDRNSLIRANATTTGNGGRVIVWADDTTGFYGRIAGRGATGNGGFAEVSGRVNLDFDGRIDLSGANGLFGTLLLDPTDIVIQAAVGNADALLPDILVGTLPANMTLSAGALAAILPTTAINIVADNNITFITPVALANCTSGTCGNLSFIAGGVFNTGGNNLTARGRNISITAASITAGSINSSLLVAPFRDGGSITLTATSGNITTTGLVRADSLSGTGGAVNLTASGNISMTDIYSYSTPGNGGVINLTASGNITTTAGLRSDSTSANAGAINLTAGGDINSSVLYSLSNSGNSGAINVTAGGNITATSDFRSDSTSGTGGAINVTAGGNITSTAGIRSYSISGNGGSVGLNAPNGSIRVDHIYTESLSGGAGTGGRVDINAGNFFLAIGNVTARDSTLASITTQGGAGDGVITITHGGGITTPFVVGNATNNGTFRAIVGGTGLNIVNNITVPVPPAVNNYGTNVSIRTSVPPAITPSILPPSILLLLTNPMPPPIPAPVIVGTPPAPELPLSSPDLQPSPTPVPSVPAVTIPLPPPEISPSPLVILPSLTPSPTPSPLPTASPSLISDPSLDLPLSLRTTLTGVTSNPQNILQALLPSAESIAIVSNPPGADISARVGALESTFQADFQQYLGITPQPSNSNPSNSSNLGNPSNSSNLDNPSNSATSDQSNSATSDQLPDSANPTRQGNAEYSLQQTQIKLNRITATTGSKPALVYVFFAPKSGINSFNSATLAGQTNRAAADEDTLEIILITAEGNPVRVQFPNAPRRVVLPVGNEFRSEVTNFRSLRGFRRPAQQMYQWLLLPLEAELQKRGITNLVFLMDTGLRSIPLAALYDGQGFIIERYSMGLMPSLNLTEPTHIPLDGSQVLAMGANTFTGTGLNPLPAVGLELNTISRLWDGAEFLNNRFTLENLKQQRQNQPFRMIHLATHGVFSPGDRSNSYIQLWDQQLRMDQLDQLNWGNPPVDLLVLSACQTALGDRDAELGFAGLAINAGVRSALASLWEVNDTATLGLMTTFYQQLQTAPVKSEALRQAQLAMLRGEVRIEAGNLVTPNGNVPLTDGLRDLGNLRLTHPYYWSAFTMVGNPW